VTTGAGTASSVRSFTTGVSMAHLSRSATAAHVRVVGLLQRPSTAHRAETGEGVISAAIVVLIMALLGAAMWAVFSDVFTGATDGIAENVDRIGG
jgi:hypothetical protein